MAKINKEYPSFYNGVTQQSPELTLDNQCKDMVNCVPDLVRGLRKRPPALFTTRRDFATYPEMENAKIFHTYDRGEDEEEYILLETLGKADEPIQIFNKIKMLHSLIHQTFFIISTSTRINELCNFFIFEDDESIGHSALRTSKAKACAATTVKTCAQRP